MAPFSYFRVPYDAFTADALPLTPPTLLGKWWVTTSSLPMWKSSKNINITYSEVPSQPNAIDDIIHYNSRSSPPASTDGPAPSTKSIHGVDHPMTDKPNDLQYKWRGKGLLFIATSKWQVIGYGGKDVRQKPAEDGKDATLEGVDWVVTYFEKSLFTPAGIDIMTFHREGLDEETMQTVREGLKSCGEVVSGLEASMFDIPRD